MAQSSLHIDFSWDRYLSLVSYLPTEQRQNHRMETPYPFGRSGGMVSVVLREKHLSHSHISSSILSAESQTHISICRLVLGLSERLSLLHWYLSGPLNFCLSVFDLCLR